jgi:phosphinothricin acetyltransferase
MAASIELASSADVPAILALSNGAIASAANMATEPEPLAEWAERFAETDAMFPWLVAREEGRVVGFAKAGPHRARRGYDWTAEVSVYVDPTDHRRGHGRTLYRRLVRVLRAQGYVTLLAGITMPNAASVGLHEAVGFVPCGAYHRVGWKLGQWHDVGYWELQLQDGAPEPIRPVASVWAKLELDHLAVDVRRVPLGHGAGLISALDRELSGRYPEPGATHFELAASDVDGDGGAFVVAYLGDEEVGCGAMRMIDARSAELKRMFVLPRWRGSGVSKAVLAALEAHAARLGAARIVLETGERQVEALALYGRAGYQPIPRFGAYVDSPLSVCLEKRLGGRRPIE